MEKNKFSQEQLNVYREDGYIVIKGFCKPAEIERLYAAALQDWKFRAN
jgi:hypothetical protein